MVSTWAESAGGQGRLRCRSQGHYNLTWRLLIIMFFVQNRPTFDSQYRMMEGGDEAQVGTRLLRRASARSPLLLYG